MDKLKNLLGGGKASSSTEKYPPPAVFPGAKDKSSWKSELDPQSYKILFEKDTERAGTGEYDGFYPAAGEGHFACKVRVI